MYDSKLTYQDAAEKLENAGEKSRKDVETK